MIDTYIKERDEIVRTASVAQFVEWVAKQGIMFSNPLSAEIALHKMRTAIRSMPDEIRAASHQWLISRGYESWK